MARDWKTTLRQSTREPEELLRELGLPGENVGAEALSHRGFSMLVPPGFVAKMQPGDPGDPLLRQVLPTREELDDVPGYSRDPVSEADRHLAPGLLKKYHGRALLVLTGACAIHCRYCFRRHYPYGDAAISHAAFEAAAGEIRADPSIREVILSGGDPLMLPDEHLASLVQTLEAIPHLHRLRVHTRMPIVVPDRVDDRLLSWLRGSALSCLVVVHANHPRELDSPVRAALARLVDAGIPVLNQAVLLRGINDDLEVLEELCTRLIDSRVMPYYLHQLDRVAGAAHFEVPRERGLALVRELRTRLPGYAVPRFVQEVPGAPNKDVLL